MGSANHFYPEKSPSSFQISQAQAQLQPPLVPWSTGLCDCFDDVSNCCTTCWCPCITFGQVSEIIDKGSSSCGTNGVLYVLLVCLVGCPCIYTFSYRSKMRKTYNIEGGGCCDCLIHCFCERCALCQEYRELQNQGFDMSIGWHGNLEKRGGVAVAPVVQGGMER